MAKNENNEAKQGKKLTVTDIRVQDQKTGFEFQGKYVGVVMGSPFKSVDDKTGEVIEKSIAFVIMEKDNGERYKLSRDKGLESALADGIVKENDKIRVVKLDKIKLKRGSMNQYDVFAL